VRVAVVGATGFVGSAVVGACRAAGHEVRPVRAPRLRSDSLSATELGKEAHAALEDLPQIRDAVQSVDVLVNAAGVADALSRDTSRLYGPNALLPVVLAVASRDANLRQFIHVSSAAVQGRRVVLDESSTRRPFSPYSQSKALAEETLEAVGGATVIYRATSVHGVSRRVTRQLVSFASSAWSSVAGDGSNPTPQVLVNAVGSAVAHLVAADAPPRIVMHPWEGITTSNLLLWLSGRRPNRIPATLARGVVDTAMSAGRFHGTAAGVARRLEMLWCGQQQADSWLTAAGWESPVGPSDWESLGRTMRLPTRSR
jgi:nucleoside-diphosphate-sugar epimerase